MSRLATAVADLAIDLGATFHYDVEVKEIAASHGRVTGVRLATGEAVPCDAVVVNADAAAVADGLFGRQFRSAVFAPKSSRSLSAVTWAFLARTGGFSLSHHNVFFSDEYEAEFADIFQRGRLPRDPTAYVCAADRSAAVGEHELQDLERLFVLVNAPPAGDEGPLDPWEIDQCRERAFGLLGRCGLQLAASTDEIVATTPFEFSHLFPGTGGALYGQASHGWSASFTRPTSKTRIPGLYLAGGSTHPGPGVPMAALSGRLAARRVMADLASMHRSHRGATPGGTSMP
jgi:1-hydroxycarotenoid 3,4-desaturase